MDYGKLAKVLVGVFSQAGTVVSLVEEAKQLYDATKSEFSATDQAQIDAAYELAKSQDAAAEKQAEQTLDEASKH